MKGPGREIVFATHLAPNLRPLSNSDRRLQRYLTDPAATVT